MSKVSYTFEVDEYVCSSLGEIRDMQKTHDYSRLAAVVERIQHHVNKMESALGTRWQVGQIVKDEKMSSAKKLKKIGEIVE